MTYHGHVENGHVVLEGGVDLPNGTPVMVTVAQKPAETEGREIPTLYERLKPIIGIAKDLPPDASTRIDEILYGRGLE